MYNLSYTFKEAAKLWYYKDAQGMAAIISYYTMFAVAPLLLLTVLIASLIYGTKFVVATLYQWGSILGPDMLELLHQSVENLEMLTGGFAVPLFGLLFFSGMVIVLFNSFTTGLHHLWGVERRGLKGWFKKIRNSILFVAILEVYIVCLIGVNGVVGSLAGIVPLVLVFSIKSLFFILATTILFSLAYRILPWERPSLPSRVFGAFIASLLLFVAKSAIAFYISTTPVPGLFGAAGIILALLIWVYISAAIIYFGAAFAYTHQVENLNNLNRIN